MLFLPYLKGGTVLAVLNGAERNSLESRCLIKADSVAEFVEYFSVLQFGCRH